MHPFEEQNQQIGLVIGTGIIEFNGYFFMGERVAPPRGKWEFPGGKIDAINKAKVKNEEIVSNLGNHSIWAETIQKIKEECANPEYSLVFREIIGEPGDRSIWEGTVREITEECADPEHPLVLECLGYLGEGLPHYVFEKEEKFERTQRVFRTRNFLFQLKAGKLIHDPKVHHRVGWFSVSEIMKNYDLLAGSAKTGFEQALRWFEQNQPPHSVCDQFNRLSNKSRPNQEWVQFKYQDGEKTKTAMAPLPLFPKEDFPSGLIESPYMDADDTLRFEALKSFHLKQTKRPRRRLQAPELYTQIAANQARAKREFLEGRTFEQEIAEMKKLYSRAQERSF
jgi:8-oxo-dGTP pyrophosphatase MutT (NUDIX family)